VDFKSTGLQVFGNELFRKEIKGTGVWRQKFVSEDGNFRAMLTPSVFVLRKAQDGL
jgi:hypothetical protein